MILGTQHFHFISDKDNCADLVYASFGSSSGRPGLTAFGWGRLIRALDFEAFVGLSCRLCKGCGLSRKKRTRLLDDGAGDEW
jgi:hypothetical protein